MICCNSQRLLRRVLQDRYGVKRRSEMETPDKEDLPGVSEQSSFDWKTSD